MDQNLIYQSPDQEMPQQNPPYVPNINSPNSNAVYNSAQNISTLEEPYYSSQSNNNDQLYPPQQYPVEPYTNQNIPPNQYYYPPQGTNPMGNYPLEPGVLNVQPNPQNQYHKPYNLIEHKGIIQTKPDTFHITTDSGKNCNPLFFLIVGIIFTIISIPFLPNSMIPLVFGICFIFVGLLLSCMSNQSAYIILYPNSINIIKKVSFSRKTLIYNLEELERIEFNYQRENNEKNNYFLNVVRKNGIFENILHFISYSQTLFTADEIKYFLFTVNNHIQARRRV